jgi:hypothetical protein
LTDTLSAPAPRQAAANAARHRERNVDHLGDPAHPRQVEAAALGACGNVVENQFVGALVTIADRLLDDVASIAMVAKLNALDDPAVLDVEARDDPTRRHRSRP